jgi:hypothetical protein
MPGYEILFLKALFVTISVEVLVLFALIKTIFKKIQLTNTIILFAGVVASFATLPYLWFVLPQFLSNRIAYIVIGELSVVLIESLIYFFFLKIKYTYSLLLSTACNLCSFLFGLIIF